MKTIIEQANDLSIRKAADIIKSGGLVAFPTETVYGLGANAFDLKAIKKIYIAKGRPSDNPLIIHIANKKNLYDLAKDIDYTTEKIIDKFWPGPVTLILKKQDYISYDITSGLDTIAIRFPSNPVAQKLINLSGVPIAAPSANLSGSPSCTRASHVIKDLNKRIDMILRDDSFSFGLESTIIDMTSRYPTILRPGAISFEELDKTLGYLDFDRYSGDLIKNNNRPKAPGMKYKHYAPKADVFIVSSDKKNVIENQIDIANKINNLILLNKDKTQKIGVLACEQTKNFYKDCFVLSLGDKNNLLDIANNLFDCLRKFDLNNINIVYAESFEQKDIGCAIMNRLLKAADYKII